MTENHQKITFSKEGFLMRVEPLSRICKAQCKDALSKAGLLGNIPSEAWHQEWVVHLKSVGNGHAALTYLAPYLYRIAISNANILSCQHDHVTFRYKEAQSGRVTTKTLTALEFIRRYLQHILPKGFQKVRYFGFLHPKNTTLSPR